MKLLFFGDSITDANRSQADNTVYSYGCGFVRVIADRLLREVGKYEIVNRGVSGNRSVDLYARIKRDVWNERPDVVTVLAGVNDVYHELKYSNGVSLKRYENIMRDIVEETKSELGGAEIILCEPFILRGSETEAYGYDDMNVIKSYAAVVRKIAKECGAGFIPLQESLDKAAAVYGAVEVLSDGIHPTVYGANIIAEIWLDYFTKLCRDKNI